MALSQLLAEVLQQIGQRLPTGRDRVALAATGVAMREALREQTQAVQAAHALIASRPRVLSHEPTLAAIHQLPESQRGEALLLLAQGMAQQHSRYYEFDLPEINGLEAAIHALPREQHPSGLVETSLALRNDIYERWRGTADEIVSAITRIRSGEQHKTGVLKSMRLIGANDSVRFGIDPRGRPLSSYVEPSGVTALRQSEDPAHQAAIARYDAVLHAPPAPARRRQPPTRPPRPPRPQQVATPARPEPARSTPQPAQRTALHLLPPTRIARPSSPEPSLQTVGAQLMRNRPGVVDAAALLARDHRVTLEQAERSVGLPRGTLRHFVTPERRLQSAEQLNALAAALAPNNVPSFQRLVTLVGTIFGAAEPSGGREDIRTAPQTAPPPPVAHWRAEAAAALMQRDTGLSHEQAEQALALPPGTLARALEPAAPPSLGDAAGSSSRARRRPATDPQADDPKGKGKLPD